MGLEELLQDRRHRLRRQDRLRHLPSFITPLVGGVAVEVGGPSALFRSGGRLPVYAVLERVDGVQFSDETAWHGRMAEGRFDPGEPGKGGRLYIREGSDLAPFADESVDVVLSSHVVEHFANPIGALREWLRVLRPGGHLLLVAPHKEGTFDHPRPVTTLEHLVEDDRRGTPEDDPTHIEEFLTLQDPRRNPHLRDDPAGFAALVRDNARNRLVHHHVFDTRAVLRLLDHLGLRLQAVEARWPHDIYVLAQKPAGDEPPANEVWMAPGAAWARHSPFRADR